MAQAAAKVSVLLPAGPSTDIVGKAGGGTTVDVAIQGTVSSKVCKAQAL